MTHRISRRVSPAPLLVAGAIALLILGGCRERREGAMPAIDLEKAPRSAYEPRDPFVEIAPGAVGKLAFQSDDTLGVRIDVRQLLIASKKTATIPYRAAALYQIRGGSGTASIRTVEFLGLEK